MSGRIADVVALFPNQEDRIRVLIAQDRRFREICGDYGDCLASLERLQAQGASAIERCTQYRELQMELEQELGAMLERMRTGPSQARQPES